MHPKNIHNSFYNFEALIKSNPNLEKFVFVNQHKIETLDFADEKAVLELNKSLLAHHHNVKNWTIPEGYLCPPIPSRADYLYYLKDLLALDLVENDNKINKSKKIIRGLDVGVGANCIYPILASQLFNWKMVGTDIDKMAIQSAKKNVESLDKSKENNIEIRHQASNANIFRGIINEDEYFDFTICNPPFHASEKEANSAAFNKNKNLKNLGNKNKLNFGGQSNELWCNGGEALFIKRMIKQSVEFRNQVNWFTTLVSKSGNLKAIYKQLDKLKAEHKTVDMEHGNKKTRFVAWRL